MAPLTMQIYVLQVRGLKELKIFRLSSVSRMGHGEFNSYAGDQ